MSTAEYVDSLKEAASTILSRLGRDSQIAKPRVMIICGSGLGKIVNVIKEPKVEIEYSEIPGFKTSTVPGHSGRLIFGLIGENNVPVMCMVGRLHFYEGYTLPETTFPVRVGALLGVSSIIVTNAAGGIRPGFVPGDLMLIEDHINFPGLSGYHPLRGPNLDEFGPRFQPLSDAYDLKLRQLFLKSAQDLNITRRIHEGTYFFAAGPTFESRAEVRMIRILGGDTVGMSTVPEVIVARHSGLRVLALSLITNEGVGEKPPSALESNQRPLDEGMASHDEVLEAANEAASDVQRIVEATVNEL